jgi:hypothetical protein
MEVIFTKEIRIYESDDIIIDIIENDLRISYFKDGHWRSESRVFEFESQEDSHFVKDTW